MKLAVLALVLANFALFVWLRWAAGPRPEANLVALTAGGKKLTLLPETAAPPAPSVPSQMQSGSAATVARAIPAPSTDPAGSGFAVMAGAAPAPESKVVCLVWPLSSATTSRGLVARLDAGGYPVHVYERKEPIPVAYRVTLAGFAGTAAAKRAVAILRRGGETGPAELPPSGTRGPALLLGAFGDREHAERRAAQVRELGFDPRIRATGRVRERRFLETRLPAAVSVSMALRAVGIVSSPRRAACTAPSPREHPRAPAAGSAP